VSLVFVDDIVAADFHPFALTRPCCELRAGALLVRQRWEMATGEKTAGFVGASHLADFDEPGAASSVSGSIPAGTILVNARCAVGLGHFPPGEAWTCDGQVAAVRLKTAVDSSEILQGGGRLDAMASNARSVAIQGRWLDQVWDLVRHLQDLLTADITALGERVERANVPGVATIGTHLAYVERGASIEPMTLFDVTAGPILVRRGAMVQAFTRLVGPCLIGENTIVNAGRIAGSAIGEHCRVHGEISASVFTGHANKAHDGFLGHSVLGRWVNLGAGTVNSNLKNNYSEVSFWTPRGVEHTGMQFLGTFLGDHAKTAIGTRMTTGAVIGTGANVYGTGITPRYVPPFAWGLDGSDVWELQAFLETAERMMNRRGVALSERARRQLTAAWQLTVEDKR
jgi:UDP-N-acetylglucosamine diphosphorylase/glucosamine-1-phosphate N-acetyltransferase